MVLKKEAELFEKMFLIIFFLVVFYLAYMVAKPFLLTVITAGILAYVTFPLYKRVFRLVRRNRTIASTIMVLFVFLVVAAPLSILGTFIAGEAVSGLNSAVEFTEKAILEGECKGENSTICVMLEQITSFTKSEFFERYIRQNMPNFSLVRTGQGFFLSVTGFIFHLFITFFALFFFFIDGDEIAAWIKDSIPLKKRYRTMIIERFKSITSGVIYGQIMTSVIQGLLAGIGFYIFDAGSPVLLGLLTAFTSIFPFIGAVGVWLPVSLVKIFYSLSISDTSGVWMGIGLIIYGTLIVSMVDNFVRPKFIGDKAKLHPLLAFVGVLGGLSIFGIIGVLLGPLIMALLVSTIEIYKEHIRDI